MDCAFPWSAHQKNENKMAPDYDRIEVNPDIMFGKPVIKGTRITVEHILRKMAEGMTIEEILAHHPHLTKDEVCAAVTFAADQLTIT
jgi:uncharacterized protein (DUF433 family)